MVPYLFIFSRNQIPTYKEQSRYSCKLLFHRGTSEHLSSPFAVCPSVLLGACDGRRGGSEFWFVNWKQPGTGACLLLGDVKP